MRTAIVSRLISVAGLALLTCSDPPGEAMLVLNIVANNSKAADVAALAATFERIELVYSSKADEEPSRIIAKKEKTAFTLKFDQTEASASFLFVLEPGFVHQLRFIAPNVTVTLQEGTTALAKLPSGSQTGIKIVPEDDVPFPVFARKTTHVLASIAVHEQLKRPPGQGFLFKPTIPAKVVAIQDTDPPPFFAPRQVYVVFKDGVSETRISEINQALGASVLRRHPRRPWLSVEIPAGVDEHEAARKYRTYTEVAWASPNYNASSINGERVPSDWGGDTGLQPWSTLARAPEAWELEIGSRQIVVAVIDTGFGYHDEIEENIFLNVGEFPSKKLRDSNCFPVDPPPPLPAVTDTAGADDGGPDGVITLADFNSDSARKTWLPLVGKNPNVAAERVRLLDLVDPNPGTCGIFEDRLDNEPNGFVDDIAGWNFLAATGTSPGNNDLQSTTGKVPDHGTTVAAVAGAAEFSTGIFNGVSTLGRAQYVGQAWRVRLLLLKAVSGGGTLADNVHAALEYAVQMGAHVATMSATTNCIAPSVDVPGVSEERKKQLTCDETQVKEINDGWQKWIDTAGASSLVLVNSTINERINIDASEVTIMPTEAKLENLISVGNVTTNKTFPTLEEARASWGPNALKISAVGIKIRSLSYDGSSGVHDGLGRLEGKTDPSFFAGSSFSAPQVAAVAALVIAKNRARFEGNPKETIKVILDGAAKVGGLGGKFKDGNVLDARKALELAGP